MSDTKGWKLRAKLAGARQKLAEKRKAGLDKLNQKWYVTFQRERKGFTPEEDSHETADDVHGSDSGSDSGSGSGRVSNA